MWVPIDKKTRKFGVYDGDLSRERERAALEIERFHLKPFEAVTEKSLPFQLLGCS